MVFQVRPRDFFWAVLGGILAYAGVALIAPKGEGRVPTMGARTMYRTLLVPAKS